jgi:hypothetical protein
MRSVTNQPTAVIRNVDATMKYQLQSARTMASGSTARAACSVSP